MRLRPEYQKRRGRTLVETAIVLLAFLTLILGMIDLGMGVFRYHALCEAARQGARLAIVHGSTPYPSGANYSSTKYWSPPTANANGTATSYPGVNPYTLPTPPTTDAIYTAISQYLVGVQPSKVTITVTWLNSSTLTTTGATNDPGMLVQVKVSAAWTPMMGFIFGNKSATLSATSTMPIAY